MANILLFSDLHVHTHKGSLRRLQHCLDTLKWVFQTAVNRGIEEVVFLGDLFQDREKIQVLPYQRTYEIINQYAGGDNPQVKLYLLVGNHDMWYADKTDISSVYPFDAISNVKVIHKCCTLQIGDIPIDFLPFTLNPITSLSGFMHNPTGQPASVLCGHIALDGAQLNTLYKTQADVSVEYDGDMVKVDADKFQPWKRVFLGHYHGAQKIKNVEYVGSPLQLNFAEAFQKKHIVVLNTQTLETEYIENTFSPAHLILNESEIDSCDLDNTFVKFQPKDIAATDLVDLKNRLTEQHNILTFEFQAPKRKEDDETKQHIAEAKNVLVQDREEMLAAYIKAVGSDDLDPEQLLAIGKELCQKSQMQ